MLDGVWSSWSVWASSSSLCPFRPLQFNSTANAASNSNPQSPNLPQHFDSQPVPACQVSIRYFWSGSHWPLLCVLCTPYVGIGFNYSTEVPRMLNDICGNEYRTWIDSFRPEQLPVMFKPKTTPMLDYETGNYGEHANMKNAQKEDINNQTRVETLGRYLVSMSVTARRRPRIWLLP